KTNILLITVDEQRWDTLSCMGNSVIKTPNIDRLAQDGILFQNAFTVSPLCVPSRTSFFTGIYPSRRERFSNHVTNQIASVDWTYLEALKNKGYRIGLAGKNHTFQPSYFKQWFDFREEYGHWGKEVGELTPSDSADKQFRHSEKRGATPGGILVEGLIDAPEPFQENECMSARITDDALRFLEQDHGVPFFLHYSFPDPHWPTVVCEPYFSMYKDQLDKIALPGFDQIDWDTHPFAHYVQSQASGYDRYTEDERKKILAVYYGQISFIDSEVGRIIAYLKSNGLYDKTLIIYNSDHGNFGGQFGLVSKTKAFYESLIRIPLIMKLPGFAGGQVVSAQLENIDVLPTVFDYLGLPVPDDIDGKSFLPVLTGKKKEHRTAIYSEVGELGLPPPPISKEIYPAYNMQRSEENMFWFIEYTTRGRCAMIRGNGWKYVYYNGDMEELYHYEDDPLELVNLAYHPEYLDLKKAMHKKLIQQNFVGIGPEEKRVKF
ncbi:MAG: sulfatase, partial [Kiritimatiellales bacterium]